jgi:hypothetical protein
MNRTNERPTNEQIEAALHELTASNFHSEEKVLRAALMIPHQVVSLHWTNEKPTNPSWYRVKPVIGEPTIVKIEPPVIPRVSQFAAPIEAEVDQSHGKALGENLVNNLASLNNDQRLEVLNIIGHAYCLDCGRKQGKFNCQCWNDE